MATLEIENKILRQVLINRNKLIEALMVELPLSGNAFKQAMGMRQQNWDKDKEIWRLNADESNNQAL